MKCKSLISTTIIIACLACVGSLRAQTSPALPDFAQTPMRVQELRGQDTFLYGEADTTMGELGQSVRSLSKQLLAARDAGKVQFAGQMIVTMTGAPGDPTSQIKLRVGFPVRPGALLRKARRSASWTANAPPQQSSAATRVRSRKPSASSIPSSPLPAWNRWVRCGNYSFTTKGRNRTTTCLFFKCW